MVHKKCLNEKSVHSKFFCNKQRNYCASILRKTNQKYFANVKDQEDCQTPFLNKISHEEIINLTHFFPMPPFSTPWKHQKALERKHWEQMR